MSEVQRSAQIDDDRAMAHAVVGLPPPDVFDLSVATSAGDSQQHKDHRPGESAQPGIAIPRTVAHPHESLGLTTPRQNAASTESRLLAGDALVDPDHDAAVARELRTGTDGRSSRSPAVKTHLPGIIGACDQLRRLATDLQRVAPANVSVLVTGESGTGKELVARAVHELSGRRGAFVAVNCGAVAPELLASQLFGHERGSFTGAAQRHAGYVEQAARGTLFLDEITEMPPALQVYLLRVIETGEITRVGGVEPIPTDVRIVAATNRDPLDAIDEGVLREDLYYRLADYIVALPPLRARGSDATLLAHFFIDRLNAEHGLSKRLSPESERAIGRHAWPGNVRELRSVIQRAYLLGDDAWVHLPPLARRTQPPQRDDGAVVFHVGMSYAEVEKEMLLRTLANVDNDKTEAARILGVSVRTIHNQLARLALAAKGNDLHA